MTLVPISAAYKLIGIGRGQPQQFYGAHGQPLGPTASQGASTYPNRLLEQYSSQPYSPAGVLLHTQRQEYPSQGQGYPEFPEGGSLDMCNRGASAKISHYPGAYTNS
jgi:hypothetical protein